MTHYKKEAKTASEAKMKRMGLHKTTKRQPTTDLRLTMVCRV
jgi:hypothetical protein